MLEHLKVCSAPEVLFAGLGGLDGNVDDFHYELCVVTRLLLQAFLGAVFLDADLVGKDQVILLVDGPLDVMDDLPHLLGPSSHGSHRKMACKVGQDTS